MKHSFNSILKHMNKQLIAERFGKALATYDREACVQQQIAHKMARLLQTSLPTRRFRNVVEFGCGTGTYSRLLLRSLRPQQLLLNDLCSQMESCCADMLGKRVRFVSGDAETLDFPRGTDLITSCSALQWLEDPEAFLRRCNHSLAPWGCIAFSTFGQQNMKEIRQLTGSGLPYRSLEELTTSLAPLYDIIYAEEEILQILFDAPMQVLHHLKQTGVTAAAQHHWTRSTLQHFCEQYARQFSCGTTVSLTYHPIYIIAKKRESLIKERESIQ